MPLVRLAAHAARNMLRFAGNFGTAPTARARIASGVWGAPPPSKFGDLLRG
jgi:hypothetical protein